MLPAKFRYELSVYDLQINSFRIKARVVTESDVLEVGIADLRSQLGRFPIVGFDFRTDFEIDVDKRRSSTNLEFGSAVWSRRDSEIDVARSRFGTNPYGTLVLYSGSCCLIIQLELLRSSVNGPHRLWQFLYDASICFVGVEMHKKINKLVVWTEDFAPCSMISNILETATDIKDFLGTALCYSKLRSRPFYQANEIEGNLQELTDQTSNIRLDWSNLTFYSSVEDIKIAMHEAFSCYGIANSTLQNTYPAAMPMPPC